MSTGKFSLRADSETTSNDNAESSVGFFFSAEQLQFDLFSNFVSDLKFTSNLDPNLKILIPISHFTKPSSAIFSENQKLDSFEMSLIDFSLSGSFCLLHQNFSESKRSFRPSDNTLCSFYTKYNLSSVEISCKLGYGEIMDNVIARKDDKSFKLDVDLRKLTFHLERNERKMSGIVFDTDKEAESERLAELTLVFGTGSTSNDATIEQMNVSVLTGKYSF